MRLHHLQITAFGPFADTVDLDLDQVSGAGLFLLSGPTGAGKTSILDAVCFALYGDVPGDRSTAKRLRCDQAGPTVRPRVELECTLGGRRFRIVRTPAWERPKKRGTGTTAEQASVSVSESIAGTWTPLTSRLDEAGDLIAGLLGMNLGQFTQVALLPQGRFQAFLRARSDERHALLQRLFRTGRFEDVEKWLRERRLTLGRRSAEALQDISVLVGRVSEAAGVPLPDGADDDLSSTVLDGSLLAWARERRTAASEALQAVTDIVAAAAAAEDDARITAEHTRSRADTAAGVATALDRRTALEARAPEIEAITARLHLAHRAVRVVPHLERAAHARAAADAAQRGVPPLLAALGHLPVDSAIESDIAEGDPSAAVLERLLRSREQLGERLGALRAALPQHATLTTLRSERDDLGRRLDAARAAAGTAQAAHDALPAAIAEHESRLAEARDRSGRVDALRHRVQEVDVLLTAHRELQALTPQVQSATGVWLAAREASATAQETLLALREARIAGMAAELAGALAVGGCCPVCGSHDHPAKATPAPEAADAHSERSAQRALDDAKNDEHLRHLHLTELQQRQRLLEAQTEGSDPTALRDELTSLREQLAEAAAAGRVAADTETRLGLMRAEEAELLRALGEHTAETARLEALGEARDAEIARLAADLTDLLDALPTDDLPAAVELLTDAARRHDRAITALRELLTTAEEALTSRALAEEAAVAAGFADLDAARAAAADEQRISGWEEQCALHRREQDAVDADLARHAGEHPDLAAVVDPDAARRQLAACLEESDRALAAHRSAREALGLAREEAGRATARCGRLVDLLADLERSLEAWAPLHRDHDRTVRLSAFVEGKSADNRLQMRLSAYVLAYRLSQVVDAANERLHVMTDHRYRLEHTAERGHRESRGGLGLLVRDDWSGEARDPATLSGGETFVVSLALALGLADVIAHEVGGAAIDTLFVDEGFGSLDADTLDDVMDTLDALRDGGRVVGVVSHVAEMRTRIPTQIVVAKARTGSTASVRVGQPI